MMQKRPRSVWKKWSKNGSLMLKRPRSVWKKWSKNGSLMQKRPRSVWKILIIKLKWTKRKRELMQKTIKICRYKLFSEF
jgi:antitoxin component YwqK of YwqJK toxin-antitoxin module